MSVGLWSLFDNLKWNSYHTRGLEGRGGEKGGREDERQSVKHNPSSKISPSPSSITYTYHFPSWGSQHVYEGHILLGDARTQHCFSQLIHTEEGGSCTERNIFNFRTHRNITSVIKLSRISTPGHYSNMHCSLVTFLTLWPFWPPIWHITMETKCSESGQGWYEGLRTTVC